MTEAEIHRHAALMDESYRWQRYIYDFTRKYYLFGRDRMIRALHLENGGSVLEIGCGTGRNLALVGRSWPKASLHGLDISAEMLKSARARLGTGAELALGDAGTFDPRHLFGRILFDRVILSYCTSMIPEWERAVANACRMLKPGGALHIVDFGAMDRLPPLVRRPLLNWLARFHVTPRRSLAAHALMIGGPCGLSGDTHEGMGGYYQHIVLTRPA